MDEPMGYLMMTINHEGRCFRLVAKPKFGISLDDFCNHLDLNRFEENDRVRKSPFLKGGVTDVPHPDGNTQTFLTLDKSDWWLNSMELDHPRDVLIYEFRMNLLDDARKKLESVVTEKDLGMEPTISTEPPPWKMHLEGMPVLSRDGIGPYVSKGVPFYPMPECELIPIEKEESEISSSVEFRIDRPTSEEAAKRLDALLESVEYDLRDELIPAEEAEIVVSHANVIRMLKEQSYRIAMLEKASKQRQLDEIEESYPLIGMSGPGSLSEEQLSKLKAYIDEINAKIKDEDRIPLIAKEESLILSDLI